MSLTVPVAEIVKANRNRLLGAHPTWERVLLSDVAIVQNGFAFPSSLFGKQEGVPLIRIRDVVRGYTDTTFTGSFDPAYLVANGDLVVGMDGDFNASLWKGPAALLNQRVCRVIPDEQFYDRRFLAHVLPGYLNAINAETSSITVKHLSSRSIEQIPLPLPPLAEQSRIVAEIETQFTRLDAAAAALERARANLKRYRAAVLAAAVSSGFAVDPCKFRDSPNKFIKTELPPERDELPHLPRCWEWATLGDFLVDIQAGRSFRCEERPPRSGEVGVVKVSAVTWGEYDQMQSKTCISADRIDPSLFIKPGDFLFSRANTIDLVGACVIARSADFPIMLSDKILRFKFKAIDPGWVLHFLRSRWGRNEIERLATGNQESMRNIGQDRIRRIRIPVPPQDVVEEIVREIDRRLSVATEIESSVKTSLKRENRLRQSVLRRAFAGQLVPQDPDEEPAIILLDRIRAERVGHVPAKRRGRSRSRVVQPLLL